jgi:hypothetical protein
MQKHLIWAYNQMAKSHLHPRKKRHCRKKPKIDLWESTWCAEFLAIESPDNTLFISQLATVITMRHELLALMSKTFHLY